MSDTKLSKQSHQLALGLDLPDNALLDTYYPGNNKQALAHIKKMAQGLILQTPGDLFLYLWGASGSGRSHLLQGACNLASELNRSAMYLPMTEIIQQQNPDFLKHLEQLDLVCIDDIQIVAKNKIWEEALFHLYNRLRDKGRTYCVIAGSGPYKSLDIELADLQSRLGWGVTYHLHPLSDEEKFNALQLRAKTRGLELPLDVGQFILRRAARNMGELYQILEKLDKASMVAQRRLTIPFIKSLNLF